MTIPGLGAITIAEYQWNRPTTVLYPGSAGDYALLGAFDYLLDCQAQEYESLSVDTVGALQDGQLLDVTIDSDWIGVMPGWMVSLEQETDWGTFTIDIGTVIPQEGPYMIISWQGLFGIEQHPARHSQHSGTGHRRAAARRPARAAGAAPQTEGIARAQTCQVSLDTEWAATPESTAFLEPDLIGFDCINAHFS